MLHCFNIFLLATSTLPAANELRSATFSPIFPTIHRRRPQKLFTRFLTQREPENGKLHAKCKQLLSPHPYRLAINARRLSPTFVILSHTVRSCSSNFCDFLSIFWTFPSLYFLLKVIRMLLDPFLFLSLLFSNTFHAAD